MNPSNKYFLAEVVIERSTYSEFVLQSHYKSIMGKSVSLNQGRETRTFPHSKEPRLIVQHDLSRNRLKFLDCTMGADVLDSMDVVKLKIKLSMMEMVEILVVTLMM